MGRHGRGIIYLCIFIIFIRRKYVRIYFVAAAAVTTEGTENRGSFSIVPVENS